jgi:hypothetical protein
LQGPVHDQFPHFNACLVSIRDDGLMTGKGLSAAQIGRGRAVKTQLRAPGGARLRNHAALAAMRLKQAPDLRAKLGQLLSEHYRM